MKLLFKQRFFSWFDSYDIYNQAGETVYTVQGQLAWGHRLKIYDSCDRELATLQQKLFTFLPRFEMYLGQQYLGCITKEFSFFRPSFSLDCNGWQVEGELFEWDYTIRDAAGGTVATVTKELLNWTDTYAIDVADPANALCALLVVLAIDAEKCSRNNG